MYINAKGVELKTSNSGNMALGTAAGGVRTGTAAADLFNSLAGSTLKGGAGNDAYVLWDNSSKVVENANEGVDTVIVQYWGAYQLAANVENAVLAGLGANGATGNALDNLLIAGTARATLDGGAGADILVGGAGADLFKVAAGGGSDVIYNFKPGWDVIKLGGYSISSFAQVKAAAVQTGADVSIKLSASETLTLRNVQLNSLGAADFSLPMTKAAAPAGSTVLSSVNQSVNNNGWYVVTNAWGATGLVANKDYTVDATFLKGDMTKGVTFNWSFGVTTDAYNLIKAYPEVIFGISPLNASRTNPTDTKQVFPVKVADLISLTATYDVSFAGNTGGFNVAYDIWLTNKAYGDKTTVTNEIMVWVHKGDFEPFGTLVGTYTKGDFTAKIYHTGTYTAIVSDKDVPVGTIDVADIINKLKAMGYVSSNDYVASIELGSEVTAGSGALTINDLDLVVTSKNAAGATVTKTVGGNGTTVTTSGGTGTGSGSGTGTTTPPNTTNTPQMYYKAATEKLVDEHGVALGTKVTTLSGSTATVTKTDTVGKLLGSDTITIAGSATTVQHYDGAGKLIGSDKQIFSADGSITTNHYTAAGVAIDTIKEYKNSAGALVTEHYDTALILIQVDKTIVDAKGGITIQHFDAGATYLGGETVAKAADGTITIRYSDPAFVMTGMTTIKTVNGATTTTHFDAKSVVTGSELSTVDANGVVKSLAYSSTYKAGDLSYFGTARADTLAGNAGVTHFHGGGGSDKITGGAGADYFHFDTAISQGDVDLIGSFAAAKDRIVLDHTVFTALGSAGALSASAFVAGTAALDANDRILFDKATGSLWYDDDGNGAHAPILLAKITADAALTAANFLVA